MSNEVQPELAADLNGEDRQPDVSRMRLNLEQALGAERGSEQLPPRIPDHELLDRIGAGAYGEVWLARSMLGRLRAVKIVYRARFEEEHPYEREFSGIAQYEPVSRTHEGLVQVLHAGRSEESFYYVMELADAAEAGEKPTVKKGQTSETKPVAYRPKTLRSELARRGRLPPVEAAQIALCLARALGYLHGRGLVHRDIKPSNVIFVEGHPKLADIGLVTGAGSSRTFVGTEGFVAPEGPGSAQSDFYSLGKLLYELATGRDRMDFPQLPPEANEGSDRESLLELNEVITRACAPDPKRRYASATELQADLNLFLAGRSLRRARGLERNVAQLKRVAAVAGVFLLAAAGGIWLVRNEARRANERAQAEAGLRRRAEAAERQTEQQLYTALLEQARATVRSGEMGHRVQTLEAIRRAAAISNTVELRREAFAALALPDLRFERELITGPDATMALLDPKFERVAVGHGTNDVEIRNAATGQLIATLRAATEQLAVCGQWSADGRFLAVGRGKQLRAPGVDVEVWEIPSRRRVLLLRQTPFGAIAFHPREPTALCSVAEDSLGLWDLEGGRKVRDFPIDGLVHQLEFSAGGQSFVAQHRIGRPWFTSLFDTATGMKLRTVPSSDWVDGLAWDPLDRWVALAVRTGEVCLLDPKTGERSVLGHHKNEARTATFSPDGNYLFTGGEEQEIICWDLRLKERAFTISSQSARLQFRADGQQCAVIGGSAVLLHSFERPAAVTELIGDLGGTLRHGAFSPDGRRLAVGGMYRLGLWDLAGNAPATIAAAAEYAKPFFSPDSSELFAFWIEKFARWRIQPPAGTNGSGPVLTPLSVPTTNRVYSGHFVSGSLLLGTEDDLEIFPATDFLSGATRRFPGGPVDGEVSANGLWIAERFVHVLWIYQLNPWRNVGNWALDSESRGHAFTPASDELAVASATGVTFLETNRWTPTRRLSVPLDANAQLIFAPDGHSFWLAHDARSAALYDTQTFQRLLSLPNGMHPLALSPDGRHLALSVDARRLQVWDLMEVRQRLRELGLDW